MITFIVLKITLDYLLFVYKSISFEFECWVFLVQICASFIVVMTKRPEDCFTCFSRA